MQHTISLQSNSCLMLIHNSGFQTLRTKKLGCCNDWKPVSLDKQCVKQPACRVIGTSKDETVGGMMQQQIVKTPTSKARSEKQGQINSKTNNKKV